MINLFVSHGTLTETILKKKYYYF